MNDAGGERPEPPETYKQVMFEWWSGDDPTPSHAEIEARWAALLANKGQTEEEVEAEWIKACAEYEQKKLERELDPVEYGEPPLWMPELEEGKWFGVAPNGTLFSLEKITTFEPQKSQSLATTSRPWWVYAYHPEWTPEVLGIWFRLGGGPQRVFSARYRAFRWITAEGNTNPAKPWSIYDSKGD